MPYDDYGNYYDDGSYNPIYDVINNAIWAGSQAAQVAEAGYQPGSNVYYAPQTSIGFPQQQQQPAQQLPIQQTPAAQRPAAQPQGSLQLSNTTLMLIVGGFLLFSLGKRGR